MKPTMPILIIVLATIFYTTSCKKDDEKMSNRELLMAFSWIRQSIKANGVEIIPDNFYACHDDDIWIYWPDETLTVDPGINKCYDDDVVSSGAWQLTSDERTLMLKMDDDEQILRIAELTKSKLVLSSEYKLDGEEITVEITYVPV